MKGLILKAIKKHKLSIQKKIITSRKMILEFVKMFEAKKAKPKKKVMHKSPKRLKRKK